MHESVERSDSGNLKKLLAEVAIPLLLLFLVNAAFARWVERTPTFPLPKFLNSSLLSGKYLAFQRTVRNGGKIDVLYTGLSPMLFVDPHQIDVSLAREGRGFNFSGPLAGPYFVGPLLERIVQPATSPVLVVHGLMPLDIIVEPSTHSRAVSQLLELPVFAMREGGLAGRLRELALTHIALLEYREVIIDLLVEREAEPPDPLTEWARATDAWGRIPNHTRTATGLILQKKEYQRKFGDFNKPLAKTAVFERTIALAGWCKEQGIDFVLVNTPVHELFFELLPHGQADYARFVRELHRTARAARVPLFDLLGENPGPPEFFSDSHHLNIAGGEWFSAELAKFLRAENLPREQREGGPPRGRTPGP